MNMLWLFLPGVLYLGIVTSYTDIKYGKIKNKDVLIGICYALIVYFLVFAFLFIKSQVNYMYFLEFGTNAVFALAVAFGLWYYKIWSAGDGKLFFAFALLLPLEVYQHGKYDWVPSTTLLFNILMLGLLTMVLLIINKSKTRHYKKALVSFMKNFNLKKLFALVTSLFAVFWFSEGALSLIGLEQNIFLKYLIAILVMTKLPKFTIYATKNKKNYYTHIMVLIVIFRLAIDKSVYSIDFWLSFLALIIIWGVFVNIFREGISFLGNEFFSKDVPMKLLKPGMILSTPVFKTKKLGGKQIEDLQKKGATVLSKRKFLYITGINEKIGEDYLDMEPEGLTKEQIIRIKKIGFKNIRASTTISFAPLIFIGVLSTILVKGNILILVRILFANG